MKARLVGHDAVLVDCDGLVEAVALRAEVVRRGVTVRDLVPAATTVLLDGLEDPVGLAADIESWSLPEGARATGELVEIPTVYDGPDLAAVAEQWDVSTDEVVRLHLETEFAVAFCGFSPGFAYCTGLPADREVARRDSPRSSVPAGSVALAGPYTAVYPTASPGGWQLLGHTDVRLWEPEADQPALLTPGTRVRFVRA